MNFFSKIFTNWKCTKITEIWNHYAELIDQEIFSVIVNASEINEECNKE